MRTSGIASLVLCLLAARSPAADWPLYRGDAARSGYTPEELSLPLEMLWVREFRHAPRPAWPSSDRLLFDRAYQVVAARGRLFLGSSADCAVYSLDAASGATVWDFVADAPVRFAPAVWRDRVFAGADDGFLYCLRAADGEVLWKRRGGPRDDRVLGNDRMVSRWPVRGGPVVLGDRVYFAAGIWPSEGIFLHALDAASGEVLWTNDTAGGLVMDQPHGGARARSGVSAQGYLVATGERLLVPTGRAVPAAFNRGDGAFLYFHLQRYGQLGGTAVAAVGPYFYNGGYLFTTATGDAAIKLGRGAMAGFPGGATYAAGSKVTVASWQEMEKRDRKGKPLTYLGLSARGTVDLGWRPVALVAAGGHAVCGGPGKVCAIDRGSVKVLWSSDVKGTAYSIAVADGRLFAGTDRGVLYSFGAAPAGAPEGEAGARVITAPTPAPAPGPGGLCTAAAGEILAAARIDEGYALDLAAGDGSLACELARRTRLQIYAIDPDPQNVEAARRRLQAAGLYGVRATVHLGDPARTPYPDAFADLVVSGRSVTEGTAVVPRREARRLLRPYGGILAIGKPGALQREERGSLAGAGSWTHQYADAANTCSSGDRLIRGPLEVLWYRDADLPMPQRHGRGPAPLVADGRLFVEGLNALRAVDAYNGRTLWEYPLPGILKDYDQDHLMGTAGTGSNICLGPDSVLVRRADRCLRLDAATGKKVGELLAPREAGGPAPTWGYIACADGMLFGSLANVEHVVKWRYLKGDMSGQFTESSALFAFDLASGERRWTYQARHSIRHNAIAAGGDRLYLIDRPLAEIDRLGYQAAAGKKKAAAPEHPPGELIALDALSGKTIWKSTVDIYGTALALSVKYGVLLMGYQPTRFRLPSERGGRLTAFDTADGYRLWDQEVDYASRFLVIDRTVYAQGGARDVRSGTARPFDFKRSYGCGILAGSANLLVFRSATLGYFDLTRPQGTQNYGGIRPGCWINTIPAGGLVLMPDAASGCQCSYLNQASMALKPAER
jgi:outer membrane protein assembly factor BamB